MVFRWATSRRSMDEDQKFGLGVNLGWSSLTRDASTRSPLWMTNGCVESLESWKHTSEIYGSTRFQGSSISVKLEISEALKDQAYRVKGEHVGIREGLSGVDVQLRPLPTAIDGTDRRLW